MNKDQEVFRPIALQEISRTIADKFTGSQIADFFNRIGVTDVTTTESTKWKYVYETLILLQKTKGKQEIVRIIEQFCDGQEFFGNTIERFSVIQKINEVLKFYKMRYDVNSSLVIHKGSEKTDEPSIRQTNLSLKFNMLLGIMPTLDLLKNKEIDMTYESVKMKFPDLPENVFELNTHFLQKHSLIEKKADSYVITKKANSIFFEDIDSTTRILRLLRLEPFDLNEIEAILHIPFDMVGGIFIAQADKLVTSTTNRSYGTPIVQLTIEGIKFLKDMDNADVSSKATVANANNVYIGETININNIQNMIDQLIVQVTNDKDLSIQDKEKLLNKLGSFKTAGNDLWEVAKTIGPSFLVEVLKKFLLSS